MREIWTMPAVTSNQGKTSVAEVYASPKKNWTLILSGRWGHRFGRALLLIGLFEPFPSLQHQVCFSLFLFGIQRVRFSRVTQTHAAGAFGDANLVLSAYSVFHCFSGCFKLLVGTLDISSLDICDFQNTLVVRVSNCFTTHEQKS